MAIFMFKGYAACIPEIKRSRYKATEEGKGKEIAARILAAAAGNYAMAASGAIEPLRPSGAALVTGAITCKS
jgi:hypothetical protein